jgi:hypothetical protein
MTDNVEEIDAVVDEIADQIEGDMPVRAAGLGIPLSELIKRVANELEARGS